MKCQLDLEMLALKKLTLPQTGQGRPDEQPQLTS